MKRIFCIICIVFSCIHAFGQEWDVLKSVVTCKTPGFMCHNEYRGQYVDVYKSKQVYRDVVNCQKYYDYLGFPYTICDTTKVLTGDLETSVLIASIPKPIYDDYQFGAELFNSGCVMITVGGLSGIIGGIMYGVGYKYNSRYGQQLITAGVVMMGIGGTFVSVSIPLLCFGDHMKRNVNRDYKLYNLYMK